MHKRVWWFAAGVALTIVIVWKGRAWYERFTPKGVADQVTAAKAGLVERASSFVDTLTDAMAEREAEIREAIGEAPAEAT